MQEKKPKPGYLWSVLTMKCPRCRRGPMFKDANPYKSLKLSHIFNMYDHCPVCHQKYEMENGFWYGTGYVRWVIIGISTDDNRVFYWLGFNCLLLIVIQPWLMRLSRVIYLYFFVRYDENYELNKPKEFDS